MQKVYTDDVSHLVTALETVGATVNHQDDDRAEVELHGNNYSLTLDIVRKGSSSPYDADYYDDREPGN